MIRLLAPKGSLEIHEEAWNAYPYCRTVITVRIVYFHSGCANVLLVAHRNKIQRLHPQYKKFVIQCIS